jgi:alpha-tubulin suppressor-like RCC1 family protein
LGEVWVWGRNSSDGGGGHGSAPVPDAGQLGHDVAGRPGRAGGALLQAGPATSAAAGRYHSAAAAGGVAYTWGLNDQGQLGRPATNAPHPVRTRLRTRARARAHSIATHTLTICSFSHTQGDEPCVSGGTCRSGLPGAVTGGGLSSERVTLVAAGRYNTLAITESGALYTWGLDGCGGAYEPSQAHVPRRVVGGGVDAARIVGASVGYVHWLAVSSDGAVFSCDTGDDGYAATLAERREGNRDGELGREGEAGLPGRVGGLLTSEVVVGVAAGRAHSLVVTRSGALFSWGNNQAQQLGRDVAAAGGTPAREPGRITHALLANGGADGDAANAASAVAAGEYFSLAALRAGGLLGWGADGNGQLGRGEAAGKEPGGGPRGIGLAAGGAAAPRVIVSLSGGYQHAAAVVVDGLAAVAARVAARGAAGELPPSAAAVVAAARDAAAVPGAPPLGNGLVTLIPRDGCALQRAKQAQNRRKRALTFCARLRLPFSTQACERGGAARETRRVVAPLAPLRAPRRHRGHVTRRVRGFTLPHGHDDGVKQPVLAPARPRRRDALPAVRAHSGRIQMRHYGPVQAAGAAPGFRGEQQQGAPFLGRIPPSAGGAF